MSSHATEATGAGNRPGVLAPSPEIAVRVTVRKDALFSREFLYGADLQHSSLHSADGKIFKQARTMNHVPARFRIQDREVHLVADHRRLYPGDANHPEQVLSRFRILSEDSGTITLSSADSSRFLAQVFEATRQEAYEAAFLPNAPSPRDHWVRGFQYDPKGDYLLQETSVILADGTIAEFMEAIFPRETLAPGPSFERIRLEGQSLAGASTGLASRYRFLKGEIIHPDGAEETVSFAKHFDLSRTPANPDGTIDWYATGNLPASLLEPVRLGIEGWNRYFRRFKGIERDVLRFRGRLPEGVKLGDPRYNVVSWDSRLQGDAATALQASDPETGKQSHALIYLSSTWIEFGERYWKSARFSNPALALQLAGDALPAGRAFGIRLLKKALFHEVGHALGLDHNFKGSLSYDPADPLSPATHSIMDYNAHELELAAFDGPGSADGPLFEYDRQALSALYNRGADILPSSPELPACNDSELDADAPAIDPFCQRHDVGKDATAYLGATLDRIRSDDLPGQTTLSQAIRAVPATVLTSQAVSGAADEAAWTALSDEVIAGIRGPLDYFYLSGRASLRRAAAFAVPFLLAFREDAVPAGYDEAALRQRAIDGIRAVLSVRALPEAVSRAIAESAEQALDQLSHATYLSSLGSAEARLRLDGVRASLAQIEPKFVSGPTGLPALRSAVLGSLSRRPPTPFFFGNLGGASVDFESVLVEQLASALSPGTFARAHSERLAAARSLSTFRGQTTAEAAIASAESGLKAEASHASTHQMRENAFELLRALAGN